MTKRFTLGIAAAAGVLAVAACSDQLTVPNYNDPTEESVSGDPMVGLQLSVTGILGQNRASFSGWISNSGIFGRESYNFFPTDARSHTHFVKQNPLDPAGFANGGAAWTDRYRNLRNLFNFREDVAAAGDRLTAEEAKAATGFAGTMEGIEYLYIVLQRHDNGGPVAVDADPNVLQPFVSRDSMYNVAASRLDEAYADLQAGGASFPFHLHSGFDEDGTFNTPATFAQFNRAFKARVEVNRASLGNPACGAGGVTCYQSALTALGGSFIDPAGSLYKGVYHVYSAENGDTQNNMNSTVNPDLLAHSSIKVDSLDDRYLAKIRKLSAPRAATGEGNSISTDIGFKMYESGSSPAPIIRNEELILIRAEARYFTGDKGGALADINLIRTRSGGIAARGPFTSDDDFITELLQQRRLSLLWEGHRWVDVRRFDRMATLPRDMENDFIQYEQPIPQAECAVRVRADASLRCPPEAKPGF